MVQERSILEAHSQHNNEKPPEYTKPTLTKLGTVSSLTAGNSGSIVDVSSPGSPPTRRS